MIIILYKFLFFLLGSFCLSKVIVQNVSLHIFHIQVSFGVTVLQKWDCILHTWLQFAFFSQQYSMEIWYVALKHFLKWLHNTPWCGCLIMSSRFYFLPNDRHLSLISVFCHQEHYHHQLAYTYTFIYQYSSFSDTGQRNCGYSVRARSILNFFSKSIHPFIYSFIQHIFVTQLRKCQYNARY